MSNTLSVTIHVLYSWGCARYGCATTPTTIWGTGTVPSPLPPLLTSPCDVDLSRHSRLEGEPAGNQSLEEQWVSQQFHPPIKDIDSSTHPRITGRGQT